ncbi:MAG: MFS transporter, partial [Desulfobacterales bacterium]|nr:MFS transporter [Desulfobacterales bacterium]
DITPANREGLTMGIFNMSMFLGLSLGPLIGGVLKDRFNLDASFICMGLLAFTGFLLSICLLPPKSSEKIIQSKGKPASWKQLLKDRNIAGLFTFRFSYAACIGVIWGFLPVFADSKFSISSSSIGILVMTGVFVSGSLNMPMGYLADRLNKKAMVVTGGLIISLALYSFVWASSFRSLFLANVFFGLGGGISVSALMALAISKGNTTKAMGSVMGLITMAHSMGMMMGSLFAGLMMDVFDLRLAFPFGAIIMLLGVVLFFIFTYKKKVETSLIITQEG